MKQPVNGLMDERAPYVALSRATALENLYMVEPTTIDQLQHKPKEDIAATLGFLQRLDKATQAPFLAGPCVFTPVTVSSAAGYGRHRHGRDGEDDTDTPGFDNGDNGAAAAAGAGCGPPAPLLTFLAPNSNSNCFFTAPSHVLSPPTTDNLYYWRNHRRLWRESSVVHSKPSVRTCTTAPCRRISW